MCGIAGIVNFNGQAPKEEQLAAMAGCIVHRGPDDLGFHLEPGIGLGFRRLSIIDLEEGHQPLANEDETVWITFNGEIYNYKALRGELTARGHRFRTKSDSEVIVHLYEQYGEDCVHHLRGMFAFAIWDRRRRILFAARDYFGIKPFYYFADGDRFAYASEIKSLLKVEGFRPEVRMDSLANYLTFQYVPDPDTMFAGIRKLPPAHTLTVSLDGRLRVRRYWEPTFSPAERPFAEVVEELRARLHDSVKHHMVSDVQRGCFLSSGIDSTAIASIMRSIEPIKTFSVGFAGANNETLIAEQTAKVIGSEHYAKIITEDDYFDTLSAAVWHQEEPVADPSAIALYHVAGLASQHVKVVLSGEGADELFGGYRIYREPHSLRYIAWLPAPFKRWLHRIASALPRGVYGRNYLLRATTPLERRFLGNARIFSEDAKAELLRVEREWLSGYRNPWQIADEIYGKTARLDAVTRMQAIDINLWLPGDILMKADKMTMAHSLELRVPFLDKEVFALAAQIPARYRIAKGTTKYVFRKAMEGIVPDFVLHRPKLGFPVPIRDWIKSGRGLQMLEEMTTAPMRQFFRADIIERYMTWHREGKGDYARKLWVLYMFALWHRKFLEEEGVARNAQAL